MEPLNPDQTAEEPQPNPPPSEADHFHGLAGDLPPRPVTLSSQAKLLPHFLTFQSKHALSAVFPRPARNERIGAGD